MPLELVWTQSPVVVRRAGTLGDGRGDHGLHGRLGFDVNLTPNAALGLSYASQFGAGVTDHTLRGNFAVRF
jgi:hypothetical protein